MPTQLLRVNEVAELLRISPRQVWKLRAMGRLPEPVRLGRSVRWRARELDAFIVNGCVVFQANDEKLHEFN